MPSSNPYNDISFKTLLELVKQQGIAVGVAEIQRIRRVFKQSPNLPREEFRDLLCDLLAKNEIQRRTITRLYNQLIPYDIPESDVEDAILSSESPTVAARQRQKSNIKPAGKAAKKPMNIWLIGGAVLSLIVASLLLFIFLNQPIETDKTATIAPQVSKQTQTPALQINKEKQDIKLLESIPRIEPIITVEAVSVWQRILPSLLLFITSSLGFFYLLQNTLKKTRVIKPATPAVSGRGRLILPPLNKRKTFYLLTGEDRRNMVWGIDRYLDEAQSKQLDISKTIKATATQGLPNICFQQLQREREIWLWQDQSSQNPDLLRLANEITETLQRYNIVVKKAYFQGFPATVKNKRREVIWSLKHDELSQQPFVLILMDADSLQQSQTRQQDTVHRVFHRIKQWDIRSAIVDCKPQSQQLCQLLKPFELECLKPHELATWLAQQEHKVSQVECSYEELQRWAMACALPDRVLMEDEIRDIHDQLNLQCHLHYNQLEYYATIKGDGLDFSKKRIELLKKLINYNKIDADFVKNSVNYWQRRYAQIDQTLSKQKYQKKPWKDSQHQHLLHIETAMLQLWDNKNKAAAIDTLFSLYQLQALSAYIKTKLGNILFLDFPSNKGKFSEQENWLILPVSWKKISPIGQIKLMKMGLGGKVYQQHHTVWDKQTTGVLSSLFGVMMIALLGGIYFALPKTAIVELNKPSAFTPILNITQNALVTGTQQHLFSYPLKTDTRVSINWKEPQKSPSRIQLNSTTELWLAGTKNAIKKSIFTHSIAILAYPKENETAQQLAIKLLDTGTADQIILGQGWQQALDKWDKPILTLANSQLLYLFPSESQLPKSLAAYRKHSALIKGSEQAILASLSKQSEQPLAEIKNIQSQILSGSPLLIGELDKPATITLAHNLQLIGIPKGEFSMGSDHGGNDEKPIHRVSIGDDFYISKTEITFEQYDAYAEATGIDKPNDSTANIGKEWGRNTRPVINVSWDDTQGYVKWLSAQSTMQCRLPSEAEWEYAARAGTKTAYFWGDEVGKNNANCDGCGSEWDNKQTAPVASFAPNAFGLHDMHGNVYEWVQDCYQENYKNAPTDGTAWEQNCTDERRVLRGGSWDLNPDGARSAVRGRVNPDYGFFSFGIRVVCSLPSES